MFTGVSPACAFMCYIVWSTPHLIRTAFRLSNIISRYLGHFFHRSHRCIASIKQWPSLLWSQSLLKINGRTDNIAFISGRWILILFLKVSRLHFYTKTKREANVQFTVESFKKGFVWWLICAIFVVFSRGVCRLFVISGQKDDKRQRFSTFRPKITKGYKIQNMLFSNLHILSIRYS